MKKFFAYLFGCLACVALGAAGLIGFEMFYKPAIKTPLPFSSPLTTGQAIDNLMPLAGKVLDAKKEPPQAVKSATIFIGGDIMLGRGVIGKISEQGLDYLFAKIKDTVTAADYAFANLEGPLTKINNKPKNDMLFHFDPGMAAALASAGFDALSLGNNHGVDEGAKGLAETHDNLKASKIEYFGDPATDNGRVLQFTAGGVEFAVIGSQDVSRKIDADAIASEVKVAKQAGEYVIVYPHWGAEYQHGASDRQKDLAHAFIDAGADLVVGSHSHVIGAVEQYKGKYILYSLGNLVFDQYFSTDTQQGLALELEVNDGAVSGIKLLPYALPQSQPDFMNGEEKAKTLNSLAAWSTPVLKDQITAGFLK